MAKDERGHGSEKRGGHSSIKQQKELRVRAFAKKRDMGSFKGILQHEGRLYSGRKAISHMKSVLKKERLNRLREKLWDEYFPKKRAK